MNHEYTALVAQHLEDRANKTCTLVELPMKPAAVPWWAEKILYDFGWVLAGSAALHTAAALPASWQPADYDFFFCCARSTTMAKVVDYLCTEFGGNVVFQVWPGLVQATLVNLKKPLLLQFILCRFLSVEHLLLNFDVSVCATAVVGGYATEDNDYSVTWRRQPMRLLATPLAQRSLADHCIIAAPGLLSLNAPERLAKYFCRGFSLYLTDLAIVHGAKLGRLFSNAESFDGHLLVPRLDLTPSSEKPHERRSYVAPTYESIIDARLGPLNNSSALMCAISSAWQSPNLENKWAQCLSAYMMRIQHRTEESDTARTYSFFSECDD